jgi:predicted acyltransferase
MKTELSNTPSSNRVVSIDALRGFTMFWITGGGKLIKGITKACPGWFSDNVLIQLKHTLWQGFTTWDLIMPMFLFIVGVAMPFSFSKKLKLGQSKRQIYIKVIKRLLILWLLGMIVQGHLLQYDISKLRLFSNTLQAIAMGYLIASVLLLELPILWQGAVTAGLLLLFWALMALVPVPGYGAGVLTAEGNLAIYIDTLILGQFRAPSSHTWILSSMTFACTVMMGVMAGHLLKSERQERSKVLWLFAAGISCIISGLLWDMAFPIIKRLWTSSMVLYAGGWSLILLAAFYLVIDIWKIRKWTFVFIVIGTNAITAYVASHIFNFKHIGNVFVGGLEKYLGDWNFFVQESAAVLVLWLILYAMYRRKVFLKI